MNFQHQELLAELQKFSRTTNPSELDTYSGSIHPTLSLKTADARNIAKTWTKQHKNIDIDDLVELLSALAGGKTLDERMMVGKILQYLPSQRHVLDPKILENWLSEYSGWAEIDSLCQSAFKYDDLLDNWSSWKNVLEQFSDSSNLSLKRASLVLLTSSVANSSDVRLSNMAFANIEKLKSEKSILITKAISWLLRSLIKYHRTEVEEYLKRNIDTLPKIAIRETTEKLLTGRKSTKKVV